MKQKLVVLCMLTLLILSFTSFGTTMSGQCPSEEYLEQVYQYTINGVVLQNNEDTLLIQITELNFTPESPYQQLGVYTEERYFIEQNGTLLLKAQPIKEGSHIFAYANKQIGDSVFDIGTENCALTITKEPVNVSGGLMVIIIFLLIAAGIYYVKRKE